MDNTVGCIHMFNEVSGLRSSQPIVTAISEPKKKQIQTQPEEPIKPRHNITSLTIKNKMKTISQKPNKFIEAKPLFRKGIQNVTLSLPTKLKIQQNHLRTNTYRSHLKQGS